jgi:tRNA-2-methylthio-N6-dimethylallyladenosine synthase
MKTFYIETFGCQMNAHDSEKVVGTLMEQGYAQVAEPEDAELVLYNTCSIRDKAEQKVFNRLQQFKKGAGKGKVFGVLGCVAQQEGERIFEKAPHVSLVAGSASYTKLPEMLVQLEAGNRRVTGLELDTTETFDTPFTRRDNPHRAYITIIEGCDKSCAYCVVPFTRGPERSRTRESVLREVNQLADTGYSEVQLLGQNVNSYRDASSGCDFAELLSHVSNVPAMRRVRFTTSHPRDFVKGIIEAIDRNPALCNHVHLPVQSGSTKLLGAMQRQYTRDEYLRRIEWMKAAKRDIAITTDIIVGFPGETEQDFEETIRLIEDVEYDAMFIFKYSKRPNTAALQYDDHHSEEEKTRRMVVLQEKQRAIQIRRHANYVGRVEEVHVEGFNKATGQWIGRTSQNKTLNFTDAGLSEPHDGETLTGKYLDVLVTRANPHSLAGESFTNQNVTSKSAVQ